MAAGGRFFITSPLTLSQNARNTEQEKEKLLDDVSNIYIFCSLSSGGWKGGDALSWQQKLPDVRDPLYARSQWRHSAKHRLDRSRGVLMTTVVHEDDVTSLNYY